jgi:hypothetical protein
MASSICARRISIGCDRAERASGPKMSWQLAQIARESAQARVHL